MPLSACRLAALGALAAVAALWHHAVTVFLPSRWVADLQYFWMAGHAWRMGADPYAPGHVAAGQARFATFTDPFFYPPWALPFFGPLSLLPPQAAAQALAALSLVALMTGAALTAFAALPAATGIATRWAAFAACLVVGGALSHPFVTIVVFGQLQVLLMAAFALWLVAARLGLRALAALALVLLALKPPFGGALILWSLWRPEHRPAALIAMAGIALLALAGLWSLDPVAALGGWVANAAAYGSLAINDPAFAAGLGWALGLAGLAPPLALVAVLIAGATLAVARGLPGTPLVAGPLVIAAVILFWPGHATDFVLLAPAAALAVTPAAGPAGPRVVLGLGLLALMQAAQIAWAFDAEAEIRGNATNAAVGTAALLAVIGALVALARPAATGQGRAASEAQTTRFGGSSPAKKA